MCVIYIGTEETWKMCTCFPNLYIIKLSKTDAHYADCICYRVLWILDLKPIYLILNWRKY